MLTELELAKAKTVLEAMTRAGLQVQQLAALLPNDKALFELVLEWDEADARNSLRGREAAVTGMQIYLDRWNRLHKSR